MATNYSTAKDVEPRALTALFKTEEDAESAYEWLLKNKGNSHRSYNREGIGLNIANFPTEP